MRLISASLGLPHALADLQTDFAICVDDRRIVATGNRRDLQARHPHAEAEHFEGMVLLPTFVNSHDHGRGLGTASLGIADDVLEGWLFGLGAQPEIDPYLAAAYDGARLLRSGVTATAHSHNPRNWRAMQSEGDATLRGYRDAGIRVAFHPPIVDQNRLIYAASPAEEATFVASLPEDLQTHAWAWLAPPLSHDEYFALCDALFTAHHDANNPTVHIQVSPAGGQWCSDELIQRAVTWAQTRGTRVQMHLLETHRQRDYAFRRWGKSFVRHLDEIGALGPWLTLAHMVWVEPDDLPLLAERRVAIAHNPSSNLRLRSGIAPLAHMIAAGITLGIGLDGHALDDDQDYLRELRLAWVLSNLRAGQPARASAHASADEREQPALPVEARRILHLGSPGGAAATFGDDVALGALVEGHLADLALVNLDFSMLDLGGLTADEAMAQLLHLATRQHVQHVMANGEWVVRDGRCTRVDETLLRAEITASVRRQLDEPMRGQAMQRLAARVRAYAPK